MYPHIRQAFMRIIFPRKVSIYPISALLNTNYHSLAASAYLDFEILAERVPVEIGCFPAYDTV